MRALVCKEYGPPDSLVIEQLDDLDERYWNLQLPSGEMVTLHLEHYTGIFAFDRDPRPEGQVSDALNELFQAAKSRSAD